MRAAALKRKIEPYAPATKSEQPWPPAAATRADHGKGATASTIGTCGYHAVGNCDAERRATADRAAAPRAAGPSAATRRRPPAAPHDGRSVPPASGHAGPRSPRGLLPQVAGTYRTGPTRAPDRAPPSARPQSARGFPAPAPAPPARAPAHRRRAVARGAAPTPRHPWSASPASTAATIARIGHHAGAMRQAAQRDDALDRQRPMHDTLLRQIGHAARQLRPRKRGQGAPFELRPSRCPAAAVRP